MTFQLIDLISQASIIEKKFAGQSNNTIVEWLQEKGKLYKLKKRSPEERQLFRFTSYLGIEATFFLNNGEFIFIGDHSTFRSTKLSS